MVYVCCVRVCVCVCGVYLHACVLVCMVCTCMHVFGHVYVYTGPPTEEVMGYFALGPTLLGPYYH